MKISPDGSSVQLNRGEYLSHIANDIASKTGKSSKEVLNDIKSLNKAYVDQDPALTHIRAVEDGGTVPSFKLPDYATSLYSNSAGQTLSLVAGGGKAPSTRKLTSPLSSPETATARARETITGAQEGERNFKVVLGEMNGVIKNNLTPEAQQKREMGELRYTDMTAADFKNPKAYAQFDALRTEINQIMTKPLQNKAPAVAEAPAAVMPETAAHQATVPPSGAPVAEAPVTPTHPELSPEKHEKYLEVSRQLRAMEPKMDPVTFQKMVTGEISSADLTLRDFDNPASYEQAVALLEEAERIAFGEEPKRAGQIEFEIHAGHKAGGLAHRPLYYPGTEEPILDLLDPGLAKDWCAENIGSEAYEVVQKLISLSASGDEQSQARLSELNQAIAFDLLATTELIKIANGEITTHDAIVQGWGEEEAKNFFYPEAVVSRYKAFEADADTYVWGRVDNAARELKAAQLRLSQRPDRDPNKSIADYSPADLDAMGIHLGTDARHLAEIQGVATQYREIEEAIPAMQKNIPYGVFAATLMGPKANYVEDTKELLAENGIELSDKAIILMRVSTFTNYEELDELAFDNQGIEADAQFAAEIRADMEKRVAAYRAKYPKEVAAAETAPHVLVMPDEEIIVKLPSKDEG